jgi:hypothetical protein
MRVACGVVAMMLVAACGDDMHRGAAADAAADAVDAVDAAPAPDVGPLPQTRQASAVIVGATQVVWSMGQEDCPIFHEGGGCPVPGPSVLTGDLATGATTAHLETVNGTQMAGDATEVFYLDSDGPAGTFLARLRLDEPYRMPTALSIPRLDVAGPAVDATDVYWAEGNGPGAGFSIRRASREGDGSDAQTIATTPLRPVGMFVLGGYVIWGSLRVPVTGGTPATFTTETNLTLLAVGPDAMYVEQYLPDTMMVQIGSLSVDGVLTPLTPEFSQYSAVRGAVLDGDTLFWRVFNDNNLYELPLTGGMPAVAVAGFPDGPFAVSSNAYLYNFTTLGFQTMPR